MYWPWASKSHRRFTVNSTFLLVHLVVNTYFLSLMSSLNLDYSKAPSSNWMLMVYNPDWWYGPKPCISAAISACAVRSALIFFSSPHQPYCLASIPFFYIPYTTAPALLLINSGLRILLNKWWILISTNKRYLNNLRRIKIKYHSVQMFIQ